MRCGVGASKALYGANTMRARKDIYDKHNVGVYHCFSRCVRRARLCGDDEFSGKNYDHRKDWIEGLLEIAAAAYVIDILTFGILDNHFHVMLRNRPDLKKKLGPMAVARRWLLLHPIRRDENGKACEPTMDEIMAITRDKRRIKELRGRLADISWLMGFVKERVARWANKEDDVTGTFFEKRYEMRRLLTENAVLACSIYIDLNPIRAGVALTPETSCHTSAYLRIQGMSARKAGETSKAAMTDRWLSAIHDGKTPEHMRFGAQSWRASDNPGLPMTEEQYLQLLDWTGRQAKKGKRGKIPDDLEPILTRLGIREERWIDLATGFNQLFRRIAGDVEEVERQARSSGKRCFHGVTNCREFFGGKPKSKE